MSLRDQLQGIYDSYCTLTPALVVQEATPEGHPLHNHFEWDDSIAGPKYREVQAAELIRSVKIVYRPEEGVERSTRAFVAPRATNKPHEYIPVEEAVADPVTRTLVLRQMRREWVAMKRRYQNFEEFWTLVQGDADETIKQETQT